jgi:hypothetical protein
MPQQPGSIVERLILDHIVAGLRKHSGLFYGISFLRDNHIAHFPSLHSCLKSDSSCSKNQEYSIG